MGQPKAILQTPDNVPGTTLLDAHIHAFTPFCQRILVVVGAHAEAIQATVNLPVEIIVNPDWNRGHMTDSLQLAPRHNYRFMIGYSSPRLTPHPVDSAGCKPSRPPRLPPYQPTSTNAVTRCWHRSVPSIKPSAMRHWRALFKELRPSNYRITSVRSTSTPPRLGGLVEWF